jgi:membrane associated rhomboid family serine protease
VIPLPYRDENPTERTPYLVITLIAINVVVWLLEWSTGVAGPTLLFGAVPAWLLHGARGGHTALGGEVYQAVPWPLSVLSSMFLHGSWAHLIGNMWFLWIFGDNIEDRMGGVRFLVFYLLCGVIAAITQVLAVPDSTLPMVGASGAIAGVMGGYLLLYPRAQVRCLWILIIFITRIRLPAWVLLGLFFVSQFFIAEGAGVAWMAHVGGFLAGLVLVKLFVRSPPAPRVRQLYPT